MTRGVGVTTGLQDLLPAWSALPVALLTTLGDVVVLGLVLATAYLLSEDDREEVVIVGLLLVAGSGIYKGLKVFFAAGRPETRLRPPADAPETVASIYDLLVSTGSYGFPSGHATGATIVYLGLAVALSVGTRRQRFGVAGVLVALVATTRVALGAHFLVDVVAGFVLGSVLVGGVFASPAWSPLDRVTTTFGVAIVGTLWFVVASGAEPRALALFAVTLVAFAGWQTFRPDLTQPVAQFR
jgi:membrane-associated phospholipid phosphatase